MKSLSVSHVTEVIKYMCIYFIYRGVIPGGLGGPQPPQLLANNTFFCFSHTTDRKVPSEVVLMGYVMSVIYGNVQLRFSRNGGAMMCICLGFGLEML